MPARVEFHGERGAPGLRGGEERRGGVAVRLRPETRGQARYGDAPGERAQDSKEHRSNAHGPAL
jgi:hypothetical protein